MRLLLILALWLQINSVFAQSLPMPGPGGVAGIGQPISLGTRSISGVTSTCNLTTIANIVAGDLVFVVVQVASNPLRTVASVGDGINTYSVAAAINNGAQFDNEIWYIENALAVGSGATITVTLSGATDNNGCAVEAGRVVGIKSASSLDKIATQSASTASPTVTTAALAQTSEIAIAASYTASAPATFTESAGFTTMVNALAVGNSDGKISTSYRLTSATTAVTYAPTWSAALSTNTAIATFKGGP